MTATVVPIHRWRPEVGFDTRIRLIRHRSGERDRGKQYTQAEFAELLDVKVGTYKAWEAGGEPEDIVGVAKLIEKHTGVPAAWTLDVDNNGSGPDEPHTQAGTSSPWGTDEFSARRARRSLQPVANSHNLPLRRVS